MADRKRREPQRVRWFIWDKDKKLQELVERICTVKCAVNVWKSYEQRGR